jgi:methyl-accepting chemotaxis protein
MANAQVLTLRKQLLGIDDNTAHNIRLAMPVIREHLDDIFEDMYRHLTSFPQVNALFANMSIAALQEKQRRHWMRLFDCAFDDAYLQSALRIGRVHFDRRVPPFAYMAAYQQVLSGLTARVAQAGFDRRQVAVIINSLSRIVMLDMELALSAYTQAMWTGPEQTLV